MGRLARGVVALALIGGAVGLARLPHARRVLGMGRSVEGVREGLEARMAPLWEERARVAGGAFGEDSGWTLVARKAERRLEVWLEGDGAPRPVHAYGVLAASGGPGPKLREGDRQVPEGRYGIESLNPNSRFHLSMKVSYPNAFDRARAAEDGRDRPGGDIFIHGGARSVGCLALGDDAIEELFWLVATVGAERFEVLMTPSEGASWEIPSGAPAWVEEMYRDLAGAASPYSWPR